MTFLTIIVPVYNKYSYLDACLESILNQSYRDFELILVDDGSTDGSGEKCDQYAGRDGRIRVIHQKNRGVSAARNAGLEVSTGRFTGFVDSDDILEKDMYDLLIRNALNNDADISVCGIKKIYHKKTKVPSTDNTISVFDKDQGLSAVLSGKLDMSANNKIFKSEIIKDIRFEGRFKEDFLFVVLAFSAASKSVFQNTPKYNYMLRDNSVSVEGFNEKDMEGLVVDEKIMYQMSKESNPRLLEEAQVNFFVQNLSTLNLILLSSVKSFRKEYIIIKDNLKKYSFLISKPGCISAKHRYAYYLFRLNPAIYKIMLNIYISLIPSEAGLRDR